MKKALIALGVIGILGAGAAYARGRMHGGGLNGRIGMMEDFIDATPQQRQVIDQAKNDIVTALKQQGPGNMHQQFLAQLTADTVDVRALNAFVDQHADVAKRVIIPNLVKIHDALTPAQRQKLAAHAKDMHHRMERFEKGE